MATGGLVDVTWWMGTQETMYFPPVPICLSVTRKPTAEEQLARNSLKFKMASRVYMEGLISGDPCDLETLPPFLKPFTGKATPILTMSTKNHEYCSSEFREM